MPGAGHTPGPCEAGSVTPQAAQLQRPESLRQDQPALQCHTPQPTPADLGLAAGCGADADSLLQRLLILAGLGIFRETAPRPETEAVLSAFDFGGMAGWWRWAAAGGGLLRLRTPGAYALLLELSAEGIAHLHCGDDPASPYESGCSWRQSRAPCSTSQVIGNTCRRFQLSIKILASAPRMDWGRVTRVT